VKYNVIHTVGASGAGTSTLGQALEREYGYKWLDTDNYFWLPTDPAFTQKRPREERIKLLSEDIQKYPKCVISGSLCEWGDVFIPQFDVVVFVDTPTKIRIERLKIREYKQFGERIRESGDMYEEHLQFIEWAASYDTAGMEQRSRVVHEDWFKLLSCPLLRVDGTKPIEELVKQVMEAN
jgi:adenylate kinase family enzyme